MNIIEIFGHLGADPESRVTPNGQKLTVLRVATNSRRSGKDTTIWYRVLLWGDDFDKMLPHFKKGSAIIVVGEMLPPETYVDREGRTQVSLSVSAEFLRFSPFGRPDRSAQEQPQAAMAGQTQSFQPAAAGGHNTGYGAPMPNASENDDSMPF